MTELAIESGMTELADLAVTPAKAGIHDRIGSGVTGI